MISFAEFNVPTLYILPADHRSLDHAYVLRHIRLRPRLRSFAVHVYLLMTYCWE